MTRWEYCLVTVDVIGDHGVTVGYMEDSKRAEHHLTEPSNPARSNPMLVFQEVIRQLGRDEWEAFSAESVSNGLNWCLKRPLSETDPS